MKATLPSCITFVPCASLHVMMEWAKKSKRRKIKIKLATYPQGTTHEHTELAS
jgi:hypothetical protein